MNLVKKEQLPYVMATLGHVIWGLSYLFTKVGLQYAETNVLLSVRFLLAFGLMNLLILIGKEHIRLRGKPWKPLALLAVAEPLYFFFETYGILYTNATFAGVVLAIVPVVSMGLAIPLLREYPTRRQALCSLLPVAGVVLMTIAGEAMGVIQPVGVVLLLCCCLTSALYRIANRKSSEAFTPFERTYMVLGASAVVFTARALISSGAAGYKAAFAEGGFWFAVIMLSVFCSVAANMVVNFAAGRMEVVKLSMFGALTTVCSMAAGVLILGEPMNAMSFAGAALVIFGIWQVTKSHT